MAYGDFTIHAYLYRDKSFVFNSFMSKMRRNLALGILVLGLCVSSCRDSKSIRLGDLGKVNTLTDYMLRMHKFDNVSGVLSSDGLPDFAGEEIERILIMPGSRGDSLRALYDVCMDTLAYVSDGVDLKKVYKSPGKFFISPTDTLAVYVDSLAVQCYRVLRFRNAFTHKIAYPKESSYVAVKSSDNKFVLIDSNVGNISE